MEPQFDRERNDTGARLPRLGVDGSRGTPMNRAISFVVLVLALAPGAVQAASQQANQVMGNWKRSDNCARQAQAAFPDFTAEAIAKRDAKLKECLEFQRLAPRESTAPRQ